MHAVDFVQESQLLLPSSDSAISRSPGTLPGNNPDCIPVNDVVRMTQHAQGNGKPQAVLPANLGTLILYKDIFQCSNIAKYDNPVPRPVSFEIVICTYNYFLIIDIWYNLLTRRALHVFNEV